MSPIRLALTVVGMSLLLLSPGRAEPPPAIAGLETLRVAHEDRTLRAFVLEADGAADLVSTSNVDGRILSRVTLKPRGTDGVFLEARPVPTSLRGVALIALAFSDGDVTTAHVVALDTRTGAITSLLRFSGSESQLAVKGGKLAVTLTAQEEVAWYDLDVDVPLATGCKREVLDRYSSESKRAAESVALSFDLASAKGIRVERCQNEAPVSPRGPARGPAPPRGG